MKKLKSFLGLLMAGVFTFTGVVSDAGALTVQAKTQSGSAQYRSVLYYGDWSIYDGQEKYFPSKINAKNITHLNFAFMDVDASGNLVFTDEYADSQAIMDGESYNDAGAYNGVLGAMSILRSKNPNIKIGISVGGWTRSGDFTTIGKSSSLRKTFAKNVTKFVDDLGFDFVDIDWEYPTDYRDPDPKGNGVSIDEGCHGAPEDGENFVLLMEDIRSELDKLEASNGKHYELSSAMSASPSFMDVIDYKRLLKSADFVNMMTYDMNGAWADFTAHHTALYTNPKYDKSTMAGAALSVDSTIKYLKQKYGSNIDYSQIVVGVAPYTRGWGGVQNNGLDSSNPGLYAKAAPNSVLDSANDTTSGTFQYRELSKLKSMYNLTEYYDEAAEAPYLYNASTGYFFTYDNARSIKAKGQYVRDNGLGGLICWMAASDDASSTITTAMKDSLFGSSSIPENEILTSAPNVSITPTASGKQYCFVFKNNENATASNAPLKVAEKFKQTVMNPTVYITFKSGAKAVSGIEAGSFKNDGNTVVVDLSGVYAAKALGAGKSHTFYITVDKDADISDIASIYVSQKITTDLPEFGKALVYGNNSAPTAAPTQAPTAKPSKAPTAAPTAKPSKAPTAAPTQAPTAKPSKAPTAAPTQAPTAKPTAKPTSAPNPGNEWAEGNTYTRGTVVSYNGSNYECIVTHTAYVGANWTPDTTPTLWKQVAGSVAPTAAPTAKPTAKPSSAPTAAPTAKPSKAPTAAPTQKPTSKPTQKPNTNEWEEGNSYTRGDVVSYNGAYYECLMTHVAYVGANWTPDTTRTLWNQVSGEAPVPTAKPTQAPTAKPTAKPSNAPTSAPTEKPTAKPSTAPTAAPTYKPVTGLKKHLVVGYWQNFVNGAKNVKIKDVPVEYDFINVSFTDNTSVAGEATFKLDQDLCNALGGYTVDEFKSDIKKVQAQGRKVLISVGGAEGRITIDSSTAAKRFTSSMKAIINEYGFDGVDIDLEGGAVSGTSYIASSLRDLHDYYGDGFIITMAPETVYVMSATSSYMKLALEIKDILTICYPQFYNSGSMLGRDGRVVYPATIDFITAQTDLYIGLGLRPDQLGIGVPCTRSAAGSGYISTSDLAKAFDTLVTGKVNGGSYKPVAAYEDLRAVMTWSINWDGTQNYSWAKDMARTMNSYN